ncbi:DUF3888 domain-containing protein [Winogradskyella psychrotolerans]|uniref:DUF3888 domain-containing protein n=1 Tax=Winogradskyella psychrotolerans TaxID=1344585 RepID=UPI001C068FE3|nr:DUF3888 domain-containing protein [Winogradskyella psychrotolerans]MBU2923052.1 DUF3888 domain-containing protein [Winogradskyella psychrotolerans]
MNFRNLAENLIIVLISVSVGGYVGYTASTASNKQTIELLRPTIEEAIRKETTSISNEFKTEIKKLKNRKGELTLDVKPIIENQIEQHGDTITVTPKKESKDRPGFFKRLFGKKQN